MFSPRTFKLFTAALLAAGLGLAAAPGGARAEAPPPSIGALWQRIPELPASAEEAARWVDKRGALVHPGLLALRADIAAHQRAIEQIQLAAAQRSQQQGAVMAQDLQQGMADIGIDAERMQRDPAYAQQVQARMRSMSPQELMAMSQKMNRPMNRDPRLRNQARDMVEDTPAARAAAEAGQAYAQGQTARMADHHARWQEAEAAVARLMQQPLALPAGKPAIEWESIGCDAACRAQWDAYATRVLPLMLARDGEALKIRRATLQRHRAAVAEGLKTADRHLLATRYGALSTSDVNQSRIVAYDGAALAEISFVLERITESVRHAAVVAHCGKQVIWAPRAVCQ